VIPCAVREFCLERKPRGARVCTFKCTLKLVSTMEPVMVRRSEVEEALGFGDSVAADLTWAR